MLTPNPSKRLETVLCSSCKAPMSLARVIPRLGGMAELHTYKCGVCGTIQTRFADEKLNAGMLGGLVPKGSDIGS